MYLYLYDSFLNNKKYAHTLAKIETRLTDLGIGGKIYRLSPLRDLQALLREEVSNDTKTIVVVGNDKTLSLVVNSIAKLDVVIGLIPVGTENEMARMLGIPEGEAACGVVAARKVERIDIGRINTTHFLSSINVESSDVTIECDERYLITPQTNDALINICNLRPLAAAGVRGDYFNPKDGLLEVLIQPVARAASGWGRFFSKTKQLKESIIPFRKIVIRSKKSVPVITDGQRVLKTPVKIEIMPKRLRLIVGKERMF
jgi:diacylglycerol kinase family enzyme